MRFFKKKPEGPPNAEVRGGYGRPGEIWAVGSYGPGQSWEYNPDSAFYLDEAPHAAPKAPETFRCEYCGAPRLGRDCKYCGSRA